MITMLLGGLWHGADWTFVVWGAYHGVLLCVTRLAGSHLDAVALPVRRVVTFALVVIGWVFFRAPDLATATWLLTSMLTPSSGEPLKDGLALLIMLVVAGVIAHTAPNSFELRHQPRPATALAMSGMVALCVLVMYTGHAAPFLYFQF